MTKKLGAAELRKTKPKRSELARIKRNPIYLVLDKIIDTYNIGSFFRLADAIACKKIFLCGQMEYPPSSRIHKAAVGTENWVPWEKRDSTLTTIKELRGQKIQIIVLEQHKNSIPYSELRPNFPLAIVVGNESSGIDAKVLGAADIIVELPMFGINKSFNVWGTAAVVSYKILESLNPEVPGLLSF